MISVLVAMAVLVGVKGGSTLTAPRDACLEDLLPQGSVGKTAFVRQAPAEQGGGRIAGKSDEFARQMRLIGIAASRGEIGPARHLVGADNAHCQICRPDEPSRNETVLRSLETARKFADVVFSPGKRIGASRESMPSRSAQRKSP